MIKARHRKGQFEETGVGFKVSSMVSAASFDPLYETELDAAYWFTANQLHFELCTVVNDPKIVLHDPHTPPERKIPDDEP